jgi:hypothetical protein
MQGVPTLEALCQAVRAHGQDMPEIRAIVRAAAADNYRFSSIVMGIVNAPAFRSSMVEQAGSN